MNKVWVMLTCMISAIIIMIGYLHWEVKIGSPGAVRVFSKEKTSEAATEKKETPKKLEQVFPESLPVEVVKKIQSAQNGGKPVKFVMYGSETTTSKAGSWPEIFKEELIQAYGNEIFEFHVLSDENKTSKEVINKDLHMKAAQVKGDIYLIEPFLLKDNGEIGILNTLLNVDEIISDIKNENPGTVVMLQPPHPIYGAKFYPKEVAEFKRFSEEKKYIYIDHWSGWPAGNDGQLKKLLDDENDPNEQGNKVWANYLVNFFISSK